MLYLDLNPYNMTYEVYILTSPALDLGRLTTTHSFDCVERCERQWRPLTPDDVVHIERRGQPEGDTRGQCQGGVAETLGEVRVGRVEEEVSVLGSTHIIEQ